MKKLFIIGFMAIMAAACGGKGASAEEKKGEETTKEQTTKEEKKSTAQTISGDWEIASIDGETPPSPMVLSLQADGVAKMTGQNEPAKWEVKEDGGKEYLMLISDKTEKSEITAYDGKNLTINADGKMVIVMKKK